MSIMMNTLLGLLCFSMFAVMINADPDMDLTFPRTQFGTWQKFGSTIFSQASAVLTTQKGMPGAIQRGAIWNQKPFPYSKSWEIILKMKVTGRNANGGAEGMALWLTERPNELGTTGSSVMGSSDRFRGLAILFDSLDNDKLRNNPSISAHYFDGSQTYGHDDDGLRTQLAGCIADYRNRPNTVASKIAYNGTHISVHVDLTGTGEYRKCIVEKLTMREGSPVYLGVSAETTVGEIQETHDVLGIEVKGVQDWSRPAPPQVNVAQGYQQQQAAYQAPPQAAYQAPPQAVYTPPQAAYTAPSQQVSGDKWAADSESSAVHDKLDQLLKASTALESGSLGNALKELEANVMKHTSGATKALFNRLQKLESIGASISGTSAQVEGLLKLTESSKASIDAGRVDTERRTNELAAKISEMSAEMASMKEQLEKSSRTTMSMIDRRIRDSQYNLSQSLKGASGGISTWLYFAVFQCMFVAFLLYRHIANKKLDKLL